MHDYLQRANAVGAFSVTVAFFLFLSVSLSGHVILNYKTTLLPSQHPVVSIDHFETFRGREDVFDMNSRLTMMGKPIFSLEADLSPLFNWNTKQLFVYLVAEYETASHDVNQMVIWDNIIKSKDDAKINMKRVEPEYFVTSYDHVLTGKKMNFTLHWNVVPYVGIFEWDKQSNAGSIFAVPSSSSSSSSSSSKKAKAKKQ